MKRIGRSALLLACICSLLLAACGNKYANSPYVGTWNAVSAEYMGIELSQEEMGIFTLTLEPDGKATMENTDGPQNGRWEEVEGGVRLDKDDSLIMKDTDGKLVLEMSGVTFTFEKA